MGISNDILFADKRKRKKRPDDYVDPPEVLALQKKYYDRWVAAGRHAPTQATMAFALACARRVWEHPEMSNREWTMRIRNIHVCREAMKRNPEIWVERGIQGTKELAKVAKRRRLTKDRRERTPFAFDETKKAGKDLPL